MIRQSSENIWDYIYVKGGNQLMSNLYQILLNNWDEALSFLFIALFNFSNSDSKLENHSMKLFLLPVCHNFYFSNTNKKYQYFASFFFTKLVTFITYS